MLPTEERILDKGNQLMSDERWQEVIDVFLSAPDILNTNYEIAWSTGWAYFKLDEYPLAINYLRHSTELAPQRSSTWWALGVVQSFTEDLEIAEETLRKSLSLKDTTLARMSLALVLMKQKKWSEAEQIHTEGLDLCPTSAARWKSYGAFLSDRGRREEALSAYRRYRALRSAKR